MTSLTLTVMAAYSAVGLMTTVHKYGIELTFSLQNGLAVFQNFFVWISATFDPIYMYLIFPQILHSVNSVYGIKLLWTAAISEWLNLVLKWILCGERPYWWVHENEVLWPNNTAPQIQQFSITCETGPGSPSGHVMITGASLFIFFKGILQLYRHQGYLVPLIGWSIYGLVMLLIATSRVYIAAHFPHQCVAGMFSGILLGYTLEKVPVDKLRLSTHLKIVCGVLFTVIAVLILLVGLKIDPNWTLALATKWCLHRDWVHLNTTPFYMIWRYSGTLLGIGLTLSSPYYTKYSRAQLSPTGCLLLVCLTAPISLLCASVIPTSVHVIVVYVSAFLLHALIPFLVLGLVKWIICEHLIHPKSQ